jgi:hypothetical protein
MYETVKAFKSKELDAYYESFLSKMKTEDLEKMLRKYGSLSIQQITLIIAELSIRKWDEPDWYED